MTSIKTAIIGTGAYAPAKVLTNKDLEKMVETSDEWIASRTGIRQRRIAGDGESSAGHSLRSSFPRSFPVALVLLDPPLARRTLLFHRIKAPNVAGNQPQQIFMASSLVIEGTP